MTTFSGATSTAGLFILKQQSQIYFSITGGAQAERGANTKIYLAEGLPGLPPTVVSMADFGFDTSVRSSFLCESSLFLRPGRYTWHAEMSGANGNSANIKGGIKIVPSQKQFITKGFGALATLLSTDGKKTAQVQARIPMVILNASNWITGRLSLIEFPEANSNSQGTELFAEPLSLSHTEFTGELSTSVYPFTPRAGFRYRATFSVNSNLPTPPVCVVEQSVV